MTDQNHTGDPAYACSPARFFSTRLRLRNGDTDQFRHVNNAAISSHLEEARMAIFQRDDLADGMQGRKVVVAHLAIDFLREIFYPGDIEVRTTPVRTGNTSFELAQALYAEGQLCARATAVCVLMDAQTGKPTPLPDLLRLGLMPPGVEGHEATH